MFWDCLRCGHGGHYKEIPKKCVCNGMTDEQVAYIKDMRSHLLRLRRIANKAIFEKDKLSQEELLDIGIYNG